MVEICKACIMLHLADAVFVQYANWYVFKKSVQYFSIFICSIVSGEMRKNNLDTTTVI